MNIHLHQSIRRLFSLQKAADMAPPARRTHYTIAFCLSFIVFCLCFSFGLKAQVSTLTCNVPERMIPPSHTGVTASSSGNLAGIGVTNEANLVNSSTTDFATINTITGNSWISVKDAFVYPAGTFAGFEIATPFALVSLGIGTKISISTYNAGVRQDSVSLDALSIGAGLLSSGAKGIIGFKSTKDFNEVRYNYSTGISLGSLSIYNAVFQKFCPGPALPANRYLTLTKPLFPLSLDVANTGVSGTIGVGNDIVNRDNLIDADTTNFAIIRLPVGLGSSGSIAVINNDIAYPAGTFAGFDIASASILDISLLGGMKIVTYNNGVAADSVSGASLLSANSALLALQRKKIGFLTKKPFDEVKLSVSGFASVATEINVYGVVLERFAAGAALPFNTLTPQITPAYPVYVNGDRSGFTGACVGCTITNSEYAVDSITTNFANITILAGLASTANFSVANPIDSFPAGTFAGFDVSFDTSLLRLNLLNGIKIVTYNNGIVADSITSSSLLSVGSSLLSGSARRIIGFITTKQFDEVKLSVGGLASVLSSINVYGVVLERFQAGIALPYNTLTPLHNPDHPVYVNGQNSGFTGLACASCTFVNSEYAVDNNLTTFARITSAAGVVSTANFAVRNAIDIYPAGTFAGFDIASTSLLSISAFGGISVATYYNGTPTGDSIGGSALVSVNSSLLGGNGRNTIGFMATRQFNEVKLVVQNTLAALMNIDVYGVVLERFQAGPLSACNTMTALTNPIYPVYVDGMNTGVDGVACTGCSIDSNQNVLDPNPSKAAIITLAAGVVTSGNFAVANAVDSFKVGSFAGFDVETVSLLSASVLGNATISLYNNGSVVQTGSGNALLVGATTSLLSGRSRQVVGIVADSVYDEVKITFNQVAGVNLGIIKLYGALFQNSCAATLLCNNAYLLNSPDFPTVINSQQTGVSGLVSAATTIQDPWNVISASTTDYARITNLASAASAASISVQDPLTTYPMGTFAGFTIQTASTLLDAGLLPAITITTYKNDTVQEVASGATLINLSVLARLIGTPTGTYNIGFKTTKPFNEIKISLSSLLSLGVGDHIDVYGAFVDTRTSATSGGGITCMKTQPDINAAFFGAPILGNVSTNDIIPAATTYGTPVADAGNPLPIVIPVMNVNGSYSFSPAKKGVHRFSVPVCVPNGVSACPSEMLTITVLDSTVGSTNPPVVNTDIAATKFNTPVSVKVLANDAIGTPGTKLDTGSIVLVASPSTKGAATVNLATGIVSYTPRAGFGGIDSLLYTVCDNQSPAKCGTAYIIITVLDSGANNAIAAADDYKESVQGMAISGNVLDNDTDPAGFSLVATPQTITTGTYSFALLANGSYTFTPLPTFTGPVAFTHRVCNTGAPDCAGATLYLLVSPLSFPLPITLESFAVRSKDCAASISWKSASENDRAQYVVEYSSNGQTWETIAIVQPKGNGSSYEQGYRPANGTGFYRLKMIDKSNKAFYSAVEKVIIDCAGNNNIQVYPNPANDLIKIVSASSGKVNTYELSDAMGRIILKGSLDASTHNELNVHNVLPGVYLLKVSVDGISSTSQVNIIR